MTAHWGNLPARAFRATGLTGGLLLMTARPDRLGSGTDPLFARAWVGLMAMGLLWGLLSVAVFGGILHLFHGIAPHFFRDSAPPFWLPAAVLAALTLAGPFRRPALDLADLLSLRKPIGRAILLLLLWAGWTACIAYLRLMPHSGQASHEQALPAYLAWIRPDHEAFRVLLLAPLWGAWAMMIAVQFCRPGEDSCPALRGFAGGCGPMLSALVMGALLWVSILYFSFLPWHQLTISAAAVVGGIAAAVLVRRLVPCLSGAVLSLANLGAQGAFVLSYLANVPR